MKIQAKEILIVLIGIIASIILTILLKNELIGFKNLSLQDIIILLIIAVIAIIYVIYKRIGEIEEEVERVKEDYNKLDERLKIHKQLTNLEARLIALEKR